MANISGGNEDVASAEASYEVVMALVEVDFRLGMVVSNPWHDVTIRVLAQHGKLETKVRTIIDLGWAPHSCERACSQAGFRAGLVTATIGTRHARTCLHSAIS